MYGGGVILLDHTPPPTATSASRYESKLEAGSWNMLIEWISVKPRGG
jgi:hypothetical protein